MGVKDDEEQRQPAASRPSKGRKGQGTHDESEQGLDDVLVLGLGPVWVLACEVVCDASPGEKVDDQLDWGTKAERWMGGETTPRLLPFPSSPLPLLWQSVRR